MSRDRIPEPLISVIMPVYNAAAYVSDAIESILAQSHQHFELIIIDDGSRDESVDIIRAYADRDSRIQPLFAPHGGRSRARNMGIAVARGEYLAWQDADDISPSERLEAQLAWLRHTGLDVCGCGTKRFGDTDGVIWFPEKQDSINAELCFRIGMLLPTIMLKTSVAKDNPFNEQVMFEEYEWYIRLTQRYRMGNMPRILHRMRCHAAQSHVLESDAFAHDLSVWRRQHFFQIYPHATHEDYTALSRASDKESCATIAELRRAGEWLVRLSRTDDNFLRRRMADRWMDLCRRSIFLGSPVYRLCRELLPSFHVPSPPGLAILLFMCLARLRQDSPLYRIAGSLKQRMDNMRGLAKEGPP